MRRQALPLRFDGCAQRPRLAILPGGLGGSRAGGAAGFGSALFCDFMTHSYFSLRSAVGRDGSYRALRSCSDGGFSRGSTAVGLTEARR